MSMVLLSIQVASADTLNITAETYETFADNRNVNIEIKLTNSTGPMNDTRVNFTTTLGTLHANHSYTNASGIVVVSISSWDLGTAKITADAPNATNTTNVTFVAGPVSKIVLVHSFSGTVNTTQLITATVYDQTAVHFDTEPNKWRVMPNVTLNFTITSPPNTTKNGPRWNSTNITPSYNITPSPNDTDESGTYNITDESGITTAVALIDKCAGSNFITVSVTNEDNNIIQVYGVIIGEAGVATRLVMSASPADVSANNIDTSKVAGRVTDKFENPLLERGSVWFNTTEDTLIMPLNYEGKAATSIGPSKFTDNVTVNGTYLNETGDCTNIMDDAVVHFYAEEPVEIVLTANVIKILERGMNGVNDATITASAIDVWGHALPYRNVNFSTTLGSLTSTAVPTNTNGEATVTFDSGTSGDAVIKAWTFNNSTEVNSTITINVTDQPFVSVDITIEPDSVSPGGIVNVTMNVSGQGNITGTRPAACAMLTLDRSGSMDPDYYAGTPLDIVEVLDRSGSMSGTPFADAQKAATMFLDNMVSNAQVGVVSYATDCTIDHPLTLLNASDNKPLVKDAINDLSTGGDTAMGEGILDASRMLDGTLDSNARNYARKIMIVLTDGRTNVGSDPMGALGYAQTNGITIYTIGLGSSLNETLLRYIAYETGGKYYNAPTSSELQGIYQRIAQEISDYDITAIEYSKEGFTPYNYEESHILVPVNHTGTFTLQYYAYSVDSNENNISVNGHDLGCILSGSDTRSHDISAYVTNGTNTIRLYQTGSYDNCFIQDVLILSDNVTIASYPGRFYPYYITGRTYNCTFTTIYYAYTDSYYINETINDLETTLDWSGEHDLDLHVTDPDAHVYGEGDDTTGYFFDDRVATPIDPENYEFGTYITSEYPDSYYGSDSYLYVTDHYNNSSIEKASILRFTLPNEPARNAQIDSVVMRLYVNNPSRVFYLSWEGYDFDQAEDYVVYHSGSDGVDPWNETRYRGECRIQLNGGGNWHYPTQPAPANNETWTSFTRRIYPTLGSNNTISFYDWFALNGTDMNETNMIRNVTITEDGAVISFNSTQYNLTASPVDYTFYAAPNPTDQRTVRVYDLLTSYTQLRWNTVDGTNPWAGGSNFSDVDYDSSYEVGSIPIEDTHRSYYVRTDVTDAMWGDDQTPDWDEGCDLVLIGDGYDGTDTDPLHDRFHKGYSRIEITYSIDKDTSESIWTHPLPGGYLNNTDYSYVDYDNLKNMTWGDWQIHATGTPDDLVDEPDPSVAATEIWFTANLSASSNATYYVYYGNPAAISQNYTGDDVFTFFEDFEDGMPGLSSFRLSTWDDQEGTWDLTPTVVNHGGHSLHLTDGNSWKDQELPEIDLSEGYALGFTARTDDGGEIYGVGVHDGTGGSADALCYRTGGSQNWGDIYLPHADAGAWNEYEVDLTTDWSNCQGDYTTLNYLTYIADDDADASINAFWDYIYIRKYAATDPTAAVGSEASSTWLTGGAWTRRMPITITEQSGTDLATYPVKITIDTPALIANGSLKSDLSDIRIIDNSGHEVPWTPRIRGRSRQDVAIDLTNHIDKKSATQLASHAFISSLDHDRGDIIGMVTYSYKDPALGNGTSVQQSYVCEGNQWEGYFTADATDVEPVYHFSLDWSDASDLDLYLYDGVELLDSSVTAGAGKPEQVESLLTASRTYRVVVNGTSIVGDDARFTLDVSKSPIQAMCTYYDDGYHRDPQYSGRNISRYRYWTGSEWTGHGMYDEGEANPVEGKYDIYQTVLRSAPARNESILGTIDFHSDLNVQVWNGSGWGEVLELSTNTYNTRKSFDIAYEQSTGRAMVVYRNNSVSDTVPAYALWDGTGWTHGSVQNIGSNTIIQVRLVPSHSSDEIMLVTMNTNNAIYAQVWDGSTWGNATTLTGSGRTYDYLCFDAAYENITNEVIVVWGQTDNKIYYQKWDGANWDIGSTSIGTTGHAPYWIKLASDPNSDQIIMGVLDSDYDINVNIWNGSAWNASSSALEVEDAASYYPRRSFDVAFEQTSGDAIVAWGDRTGTPKYKIWNGAGWGAEQSASDVGSGYIYWVQLEPDMGSDEIFLMTSDCDNDINIQKWSGAAWSAATEVETQSVYGTQWQYGYESFGITSSTSTQTMCIYYDYGPNSKSDVPRYKLWDGLAWSGEYEANPVYGNTHDDYALLYVGRSLIRASPTSSEFILGTTDYTRDINVQIWDDSGWSSPRVLSNTTHHDYRRAFDIAYEQLSGRAMIVYKGDCDTNVPEYQIWDGSTSTWTGGYVNSSIGDWMAMNRVDRLVPKPGTNEMMLLTMNWHNDLYAQIWNGSAWGDSHLITATARTASYQCFDAAYEYGTGEFVVVWSEHDPYEVRYCTFNGTWSTPTILYDESSSDEAFWIKLASDTNSNNIIMGALDDARDINVSIWDGASWSAVIEVEDNAPGDDRRYFDVAFEQSSGRGMIAWSDNTYTPKYRAWDGVWSNETSASNIGYYVRWVRLEPDPLSDEIFLMTSDYANDINVQKWDGSEWSDAVELESRSYYSYECFDITCRDTTTTPTTVNWVEWRAATDVTLGSGCFNDTNASIDDITADGMTAIDEGLFNANDVIIPKAGYNNKTIVLMTDGIDNVGYHSMIGEADRAAANDIRIYTIGFGSDIDDRTLRQIANITGGTYYFAPNATVLKEIFKGIAGELGNFTPTAPKITIQIANNTTIEGFYVNVTYVNDSANETYFTCTGPIDDECSAGFYSHDDPSNPNITYTETRTKLTWTPIGNRPDNVITIGRYWRVWYQMQIDENCGNVIPVILQPANVTYEDGGDMITVDVPNSSVNVEGNASEEMSSKSATKLTLSDEAESKGPPTRHPPTKPNTIVEYACKLTAELRDEGSDKVEIGALVEFRASSGTLYNRTYPEPGNDTPLRTFNETTSTLNNNNAVVWLCSDAPGTITVWAYHTPENGTRLNASRSVTFHSRESPPIIPPAPNPRGAITLE